MNLGAAILTFREGLEASLIIAILLGYLRKIGRAELRSYVWAGLASAFAATIGFVVLLQFLGTQFKDPAEAIYEGCTSVLAVVMVTSMSLWMSRQGRRMKGDLEEGVRESLRAGGAAALFTLVFLTVIREGIETGLFLSAAAFASSQLDILVGGLIGLAGAVVAALAMYRWGIRLDLRRFFQVAAILLVIFGAAILRHGVAEFETAGVLPPLVPHIWNTGGWLPDGRGLGSLLQTLVGYTAAPSLLEVMVFVAYYLVVAAILWRPWQQLRARVGRERDIAATT
jgi:high-affinity iron transporter